MFLSLNGVFWPMILPLFRGSRRTSLTLDPIMDFRQVEGQQECANAGSRRMHRSRQFQSLAFPESQLPGAPSYSHCRPEAVLRQRQICRGFAEVAALAG